MYVKDCGYGRSRRCRRRIWPIIGICVLAMGMSGVTFQVMAGPVRNTRAVMNMEPEIITPIETIEEQTVETENAPIMAEPESIQNKIVEDDTVLVAIDPGHGGEDEGCSREGVNEKEINLQIAALLREKLKKMGYEVLMTRDEDVAISLEERVALANEARADIYISIHQNACEERESEVSGIETFYSVTKDGADSKRLSQLIHNDVILYTDKKDRGIREVENLYVIRETDMPSCLIETGFLSNEEDRTSLTDEAFQKRIVEGITSGIDLYFNPKTMYLTFDDGPSPEYTERILDVLEEKNIKATFFVIGENVRKNPEIAKRIVEEGHTIGIHCNWHDYDTLYESVDSYVADFEKAYQIVYEVTGVEVSLFRFPGGSINAYNKKVYQDIIEEMTDRGYIYYDWNASLEDAVARSTPEELIRNARESTLGRKKVVLLAHDIVENTSLCLEELIEQFPEYKMEPLTPEVEPIQF